MRFVTTVHKAGFDEYGYRLRDTEKNLPGELKWYTEGFELPGSVSVDTLGRLKAFKEANSGFKPPSYLFDVVRFSNKVFAAYEGLRDHQGLGAWIDADVIVYRPLPEKVLIDALGDAYIALFKRRGMYSETGFWLVNCDHPEHKAFMDTWVRWYEERAFKSLPHWTDCDTLDATIRRFEKDGRIKSVSLSGEFEVDMHPMAKAELGKYLDHCKGNRKQGGFSPENRHRLTDEPYQLNDCK